MKLAVEVVRAQDLKAKNGHGGANSFVEVEFAGQRRRTATKLNSLSPQWNETLFFDVADPLDLPQRSIVVSVFHEDLAAGRPRRFLGRVRLSGSSAAPSRLDASRQFCPLDKRSLFSNVRGEIDLRLYVVHDAGGYRAADGHLHLSSTHPPSSPARESGGSVEILLEPTPPNVSSAAAAVAAAATAETLPPKKKERRDFYSIGTSSPPTKTHARYTAQVFSTHEKKQRSPSQFYYRGSHEQARPTVPAAPPPKAEYKLVETQPPLAALHGYPCTSDSDKIKNTFDLVEQMDFLYVRVVRARELPAMDITASIDPYVAVKLGDVTLSTRHLEQNRNPEWEEAFAFSKVHVRAPRLELAVKDKNLIKDNVVGEVSVGVGDLPKRVPPDGPVAPQWYQLRKGNSAGDDGSHRGEIMMAVWWGTQADEAYPVAVHSDTHHLPPVAVQHTSGKVYYNPRMRYLRVNVVSAQDLPVSRPDPEIHVLAQLGAQAQQTQVSPVRSRNATWKNEVFFLVAAEPFNERLVLTVVDMVAPNKPEPVARVFVPKNAIKNHADHRKPLGPQWLALESPEGGASGDYGKLNVAFYYDNNYHVLDEYAHFSSDYQPSAKPLQRSDIGSLELGILDARNLAPVMTGGGKSANAYCVAKYGRKWVRSRTILGTTAPAWNEQYSWNVHDPYTVLTVAVFNNNHIDIKNNGSGGGSRDEPLGKIRIRLSTLYINRVYTHYYPLMVVHSSGLKKTAELHLAVRFTCKSWINTLFLYMKPTLPKMHYLHPIPVLQMDFLRRHTRLCVEAKLARAEPPLRRDAVEYMLDDGSSRFGLRKAKANFQRVIDLFSEVKDLAEWFNDVRRWKRPATTVLVHAMLFVLLCQPSLLVPAAFLFLFLVGAWRYGRRSQLPAHVDMSLADVALPDELDEELDGLPSIRPNEVIMGRYDRLRIVAGRLQEMVGNVANNAERLEALVSWRDPRATAIFAAFAASMAVIFYVVPLQLLAAASGLYVMRHPKFRSKTPSVPLNFFKRLPGKADTLL